MPVYQLSKAPVFPNPNMADDEGLVAYGGDLSTERLIAAYRAGIFPWYDEYSPDLMWWSPNPRMVLYPDNFKLSKSLRRRIKKQEFEIKIDTAFDQVIAACSTAPRQEQDGTWITSDMQKAYIELHQLGLAHSVECWQEGKLVGGLYGISLGRMFCGESMFHHVSDASKVAFYYLTVLAKQLKFEFIDCQMHTDHLESLGAHEISRAVYLDFVAKNNAYETLQGAWSHLLG